MGSSVWGNAGLLLRLRVLCFSTTLAACVLTTAVPLPLLAGVTTPQAAATRSVSAEVAVPGFAEQSIAMGLTPLPRALVQSVGATADGRRLDVATTAASAPAGLGSAGHFFRRAETFSVGDDTGETRSVVDTEMLVSYAAGRVSILWAYEVSPAVDEIAGYPTGLAGLTIDRLLEFDLSGFDLLAQRHATGDAVDADLVSRLLAAGDLSYANVEDTVAITPHGHATTIVPTADFDFAALALPDANGAITNGSAAGRVRDCFEDNGTTISIAAALCLVAGAVGCGVACAVTAGVACIPCISGASLVCGLGTAAGSLGFCLAKALFGVDPPPTATRTPTRTRTRTPTFTATPSIPGDCDGDGRISIVDLIYSVGVALGNNDLEGCSPLDINGNGRVDISELVRAIRTALA